MFAHGGENAGGKAKVAGNDVFHSHAIATLGPLYSTNRMLEERAAVSDIPAGTMYSAGDSVKKCRVILDRTR